MLVQSAVIRQDKKITRRISSGRLDLRPFCLASTLSYCRRLSVRVSVLYQSRQIDQSSLLYVSFSFFHFGLFCDAITLVRSSVPVSNSLYDGSLHIAIGYATVNESSNIPRHCMAAGLGLAVCTGIPEYSVRITRVQYCISLFPLELRVVETKVVVYRTGRQRD